MKSSDLYVQAVGIAQSHPEVASALGQPIEPGWYVIGSINSSGSDEEVKLTVPLKGPHASATLYIEGQKRRGLVTYSELAVVVDGPGSHIDISPR